MKSKKHIDRLFKEQFKHLDVTPPPVVWENISAALQKEKTPKRVVPLWYKLAGVAATLLLFLGIGGLFFNSPMGVDVTSENSLPSPNTEITPPDSSTITQDSQNNNIVQHSSNPAIDAEAETTTDTPKTKNQIHSNELTQTIAVKSDEQKPKQTTTQAVKTDIAQSTTHQKETETKTSTESKHFEKITFPKTDTKEDIAIAEPLEENNKKSLLDYIAQREEDAIALRESPTGPRWEVAPNFAPVYYNTLGSGSSIDPQFSNNSKSGEVNFSYGLNVSYAFNEKLSIRTGVNLVDLSYSTNNIEFAIAEAPQGLKSIDYKNSNYVVAVGNRGTLSPPPNSLPTMTNDGTVIVPRNGVIPGAMQHELNYLEVPLELKYTLSNNRIGVNVLGGMSTFVLSNNSVSVMSDGFRSEIGSTNNLNNVSFSTNLGLGFDYKFTRRFVFNLEPVFKYQLNAYNDNSIDFKPYIFGVYSGFSYKF